MHGDDSFQQDWLFWTEIRLFSTDNPGGDFLFTPFYLRLLLAMLFVGTAHGVKRTAMALYFGKRTVVMYKKRLDQLLQDMTLVEEVAQLAVDLDLHDVVLDNTRDTSLNLRKTTFDKWGTSQQYTVPSRENSADIDSVDGTKAGTSSRLKTNSTLEDEELTEDEEELDEEDDGEDTDENNEQTEGSGHEENIDEAEGLRNFSDRRSPVWQAEPKSVTTSAVKVKAFLDRWDEPVNKMDQQVDASIADILKFRKAMAYMNDKYPFSSSFGPAGNRNECIKSTQKVFRKLLRATLNGGEAIPFWLIKEVAIDTHNGETVVNEAKCVRLKRLFRPNVEDELPLVAFAQSCDGVYKRLCFFRASVGNSSVIDKVLESIFDTLFNFILGLMILGVFQINPYPMLVSISTLMVSFAFAFGPSASKYIAGVLLIAIRRPYDLGDRILVCSPDNVKNPGYAYTWFVEDINVFTTTIRFAATNEVATVNNGTLSTLRIVNCSRSSNAVVSFTLKFKLDQMSSDTTALFKNEVLALVKQRTRAWESLLFFRCNEIDTNINLVVFQMSVKHRRTWQDASLILEHRADILWHCMELGRQLGVNYVSPIPSNKIMLTERKIEKLQDEQPFVSEKPPTLESAMKVAGLS
mmetsp:Transcript_8271/g.11966  ORF Transcript_8271/g.11966 Transcript_8271/m.11966 type:complete len:635 (-) Transcript_8271:61-1965(-)